MGIREEIEELRRPSLLGSQCQQEYDWLGRQVYNALQVEGDTIIDQVLSILDEWKLVARWIVNDDVSNVPRGIREHFGPGNEVAIYKRRGKEDESLSD